MRLRLLALPLVLLLGACSTATPVPTSSASPAPAPTPTFTDVSRGDTDSIVRLLTYQSGKDKAIVVEPIIFMINPDFCEAFHLPPDNQQCQSAWNTADSEAKITLPRADDAEFALVGASGNDDLTQCMDEQAAATCKASAKEFAAWYEYNSTPMVRLKTRNGVAVSLAEVYIP
ncbi:hypothetical protein [Actinoplanes rectilineatus]|uniref:hypothetical protein n=1 Tax=Actinoplanes rectilineatus TaxID=113571 RepID=UPI0005F2A660|nr:hypothetical protein [Actinoplanes rectilineatus]